MAQLEVNIVMNHPDNVSHEEALADLTKTLEQAGTVEIAKDEEGEETMTIDKEWTTEETAKEEERKRQREEDKKAVSEFSERARERAKSISDADLPSHAQLWDDVRKFELKVQMATEKLAEEELKEDNSPQVESERVKIYGRGSAY